METLVYSHEKEKTTPQTLLAELGRILIEAVTSCDRVSPLSPQYAAIARKWLNQVAVIIGRVSVDVGLETSLATELDAYRRQLLADQHKESASFADVNAAKAMIERLRTALTESASQAA